MDRDTTKLESISRDLSHLGLELSNRVEPPDQEFYERMGSAFVALSEAVADISEALKRGAKSRGEDA